MPIALRVENLSKKYIIGHNIKKHDLFRDVLSDKFNACAQKLLRPFAVLPYRSTSTEEFWALKNVTFDVKQGDILGLIGRNGAGKSTLLKILSRITVPTEGKISIKGRVASLLEVGTGFHPELTGRENIYLNGAILGMSRIDIKRNFDEIVAFAEVERFIDTPVKRYSSGMYVRLAFAVAAHLEPEILIIDEVLAVGDSQFQKKCLGKMQDVGKEGRTVLFVSHSMDSVLRLCNKAILINNGQAQPADVTENVVSAYLQGHIKSSSRMIWDPHKAPGNETVRLLETFTHNEKGEVKNSFEISRPVGVTMVYEVLRPGAVLTPAFSFMNNLGVNIFDSHDTTLKWRNDRKQAGKYKSTVWIPGNLLSEGVVMVNAAITTPDPFQIHLHERDVLAFNITDDFQEVSARGGYVGAFPGMVRPLLRWELEHSNS